MDEFPPVILRCKECDHEIMRSALEDGKWIHVDDEFFLNKQEWKYDHAARPRFIDYEGHTGGAGQEATPSA